MLVVCNFTPMVHAGYRVGTPRGGFWKEVLNSDAGQYWGSGQGNPRAIRAKKLPWHGRPYSINVTLPPLSVVFLKSKGQASESGI